MVLESLLDGRAPWPLFMYGPAGTGKTLAAIWAANQVPGSVYVLLTELVDAVWEREHLVWRVLRESPLPVVDEVGIGDRERDYVALKRAADILEWRPVIWVANLTPQGLQQAYDDRIASRLCCGTQLLVDGPDQRLCRTVQH